jgi:hypothetical protein
MCARKEAWQLRGYADRVLLDVDCKLPRPSGKFKERLANATRMLARGNDDKRRSRAGCRTHS